MKCLPLQQPFPSHTGGNLYYMAFEYRSLNDLVYSIPDSEKRAMNLPISISQPDGTAVLEVSDDKGNQPAAYTGMYGKIKDAIDLLLAYSAQLERMEDKRFAKAEQIKNELFGGGELRLFFQNIISSPFMDWDRRMELAESLFSQSSNHIISALAKDSKYQDTIVGPLKAAAKQLEEMILEIRSTRELQKDRDEMYRRSSQIKSIRMFQPMQNHHNVMCNFCVRTNHNESLLIALSKITHEQDCEFRQDHDLPAEQLLKPEILAHYARLKPLTPTKEQTHEDEVLDSIETGQLGHSNDKPKKSSKKRGRKNKY